MKEIREMWDPRYTENQGSMSKQKCTGEYN